MALRESIDENVAVHGDSPLSATGEHQLCFRLKTKAEHFRRLSPTVVFCSPLRRALRTALVAYPNQKIVVDPRLRELDANTGMQRDEMQSFIETACPNRKAKVDVSRVRSIWWAAEHSEDAERRVQRVLWDIYKKASKG